MLLRNADNEARAPQANRVNHGPSGRHAFIWLRSRVTRKTKAWLGDTGGGGERGWKSRARWALGPGDDPLGGVGPARSGSRDHYEIGLGGGSAFVASWVELCETKS